MACEVNNKEIYSQCAELLVRPTYFNSKIIVKTEGFTLLLFFVFQLLLVSLRLTLQYRT